MYKAFILLNSESGTEKLVLNEIKSFQAVKNAYRVFGVYDIILHIEEKDSQLVEQVITNQIRKIKNVRSTLTLYVTN